ncbi:Trehalose utilization [Aquisphaera giovannonii]|uniref:Trehalose utilization n=1 Tax=Aquisphaera giovannonii TaxID=406548 RepID=A0A5B9W7I1_9BACT|nr:alpha-amylase family protein [Aquisphaera giovannonii]QEH36089.1 Trehalose utilization [Aquisphaera giovannonii]
MRTIAGLVGPAWASALGIWLAWAASAPARGGDDIPAIDAAGLPPRSVPAPLPKRPVPGWLRTNLRIGHLPPGLERMPEAFAAAGYNVITINALRKWDVVGPTANLYPAEEVRQADDYLRRFVALVHGAGAKAVLYIGPVQVPMFSPEFARAHPDWLRINPDGRPDPSPNFANIRSPYAGWMLAQMAYVVKTYEIDGFWLDGYAPDHLHTYDPATRAAFRAASGGAEIPARAGGGFDVLRDPIARRYLAWHEAYFLDLADRMRGAIRAENPEAAIFVNHSANRTWYFPEAYMGEYPLRYCEAVDVSAVELHWDVPGDALYHPFVYAFLASLTHGRGATSWLQPQAHGISGVSPPVEFRLRYFEGPPWGVYPEFVEPTGREDYLRTWAADAKARDPWWVGSEPVPYVGIVASDQSRTLAAKAALPAYVSHVLGAFRSFLEAHVPVRILTELDLEDADLRGIRVLVLPDTSVLSDRSAEVIRRFVRGGGGLVATYEAGLHDPEYRRRDDFVLGDLLRARHLSSRVVTRRDEALQVDLGDAHPILDDPEILGQQNTSWRNPSGEPPARGPLAVIASATIVEALPDGRVLATFAGDERSPGKRFPAAIASEYGKGRVVYFPVGIDKAMFFYPNTFLRRLIVNACRWAAKQEPPPVEVRGPLLLCATFRRQPEAKRTVVHLLNHASSWGMHSIYQKVAPLPEELRKQYGFPDRSELRGTWPVREEVIPLHDVRVLCRVPGVRRATQQPEGRDLPLHAIEGGVEVVVPVVEMHSMVVFE